MKTQTFQTSTSLPTAPVRAARAARSPLSVRAQAGPSNPIGIHAQVWVGDWSKEEAVKAISGTKKAGYDLIERESINCGMCTQRHSHRSCILRTFRNSLLLIAHASHVLFRKLPDVRVGCDASEAHHQRY